MSVCQEPPSPMCKGKFRDRQIACRRHAYEYGVDNLEIYSWTWLTTRVR